MRRMSVPAALMAAAMLLTLAGCGSGDTTVAKTPEARSVAPPPAAPPPPPPPPPASSAPPPIATAAPPPVDPCAVNLGAPEITQAVASLPPDPRSGQGWSPEPLAGNYNECAQLSAVIVKANTNADNPNTRAVMFHRGKFIPTGVPETFGFNAIDPVGEHRRHRCAEVLQRRPRTRQRRAVPVERRGGGARRQHRVTRDQALVTRGCRWAHLQ